MRLWRHLGLIALVYTVTILLLGFCAGRASAHEPYTDWKMPDSPSVSCCNGLDCRAVPAGMDIDGRWTAWVEGKPVAIPPHKVMRGPSPDGRSHWCGANGTTYCFMPGEVRS